MQGVMTRDRDEALQTLRHLSFLMDSAFRFPGTNFRFGFDALLGLLPGIGDLISFCFSLYIIFQAHYIGVSKWMITKMIFNVTIDMLIGSIPILGNIFDFLFKANQRNLRMIGVQPEQPE